MTNLLSKEGIAFIIERVLNNAKEATSDRNNATEEEDVIYHSGRVEAYYEILDTIKNELLIKDQDIKEFGLDFNLEQIA